MQNTETILVSEQDLESFLTLTGMAFELDADYLHNHAEQLLKLYRVLDRNAPAADFCMLLVETEKEKLHAM